MRPELLLQRRGVLQNEVENRVVVLRPKRAALGGLRVVGGPEEPLEDGARVGFLGYGRRGRAPGDGVRVGAGVARVAVARKAAALAPDLQAREAGQVADLIGRELIRRDARANPGAARLDRVAAGEPGRRRPGVVAAAVAERERVRLSQAGEDVELGLVWRERLHDGREREVLAFGSGRPQPHVHAVRDEEKRHPNRLVRGGTARPRRGGHHRFQRRKRHQGAEAAKRGLSRDSWCHRVV